MDLELELYPNNPAAGGGKAGSKGSGSKRGAAATSAKKKREAQKAALIAKQAQEGGFNPFLGLRASKLDSRKDEISYDWVRR